MLARLKALEILTSWVGQKEVGPNNRGPFVEMLQRADALGNPDIGYAWCQSAQNAAWRLATGGKIVRVGGRDEIQGGQMLLGGTASVGMAVAEARSKGLIVTRPFKGDHFAMHLDDNNWADHTGQVEKVLQIGPVLILQTVEGNTGPGEGGSQSDGDGLYRRRRVVRASKVVFYRMPGDAPKPPAPVYEYRFDLFIGEPGKRRSLGTYRTRLAVTDRVKVALATMPVNHSIRINRRKVRVG